MSTELLTGCVKWFNHNLNYGFITVMTEGQYNKNDIFVHQSNIKTKNDCYRTLLPGECVQFEISKSENSSHPFHAVNVTGFNNGLLNCELSRSRNFNNKAREHDGNNDNNYNNYNNDNNDNKEKVNSYGNGHVRGRGRGSSRGSSRGRGFSGNRNTNTNTMFSRQEDKVLNNDMSSLRI